MPPTPAADDLPARLEAALTERFTALGNPFSEMRRHEQGPDGWPASHPVGPHQVAEVLRELIAAPAQAATVTEYRVPPVPPNFTPLTVRRDPAYDGTRWAVLHDPGDSSVRRILTPEGWEMAWASTHEEAYCWPDAETALTAATRAQGRHEEDDGGTDGVGRTAASYQAPAAGPTS